ncbi:LysE family translocator [Akkermansiaceae bacterium]|nr:LysE family translocator [Akkermansiaceae bacterium]
MTSELLGFAVIIAIGQFSPGPDMLLLTRTSLAEGLKAGWAMVVGIVIGLAFHATLAIGGMAVLLSRGGLLSQMVSWAAALYLTWLAWGILKKKEDLGEGVSNESDFRSPYLRGLFCNLLNPKVLVFFAGVIAPFLDGEREPWFLVSLWSIIVFEGLLLWGLWVWLLQIPKIKRIYQKVGRALDIVFAIGLIALAVSLVLRSWGVSPQ